uniref:Domain of unknown function DB domain-containing protein n=1 Tax=Romanomermis culicivorax TaxID=13658 RepID=A0A915JSQ9_ROMCU
MAMLPKDLRPVEDISRRGHVTEIISTIDLHERLFSKRGNMRSLENYFSSFWLILPYFPLLLFSVANLSSGQTCDSACRENRLRDCCTNLIKNPNCLSLCKFNTSSDELAEKGVSCIKELKYWTYCVADTRDNTDCCKSKGVQSDCFPLCAGGASNICSSFMSKFSKFLTCINKIDLILACHRDSLTDQSLWSKDKKLTDDCGA